jgi:hypothetical protein
MQGQGLFPTLTSRGVSSPIHCLREGGSSICLPALFRVPLTFSFVQLSSFPGAQVVVPRCSFRCCLASMTTSPLQSPFYVTVIAEQVSVMFFFVVYFTSCRYLRLCSRMVRWLLKLKGLGRKRSWHTRSTVPTFSYDWGKKTPWLLVRKRTMPTERPPLVGEVSANFCG